MKEADWRDKDEEALERLLLERWLYRGGMLAVMLLAAIVTTFLGTRGVTTWGDVATVVALVALALSAAVTAFVMRLEDIRIYRELFRRRRGRG
jgi:hypothetical protein